MHCTFSEEQSTRCTLSTYDAVPNFSVLESIYFLVIKTSFVYKNASFDS